MARGAMHAEAGDFVGSGGPTAAAAPRMPRLLGRVGKQQEGRERGFNSPDCKNFPDKQAVPVSLAAADWAAMQPMKVELPSGGESLLQAEQQQEQRPPLSLPPPPRAELPPPFALEASPLLHWGSPLVAPAHPAQFQELWQPSRALAEARSIPAGPPGRFFDVPQAGRTPFGDGVGVPGGIRDFGPPALMATTPGPAAAPSPRGRLPLPPPGLEPSVPPAHQFGNLALQPHLPEDLRAARFGSERSSSPRGSDQVESASLAPAAIGDACQRRRRGGIRDKRFTAKFVFTGYDHDQHADFELVPRLIGRGGCNMRAISDVCKGKVRVRGRGSGHNEEMRDDLTPSEADVPLQIALSCRDGAAFQAGKSMLVELLESIAAHFAKYCRSHEIELPELYQVF